MTPLASSMPNHSKVPCHHWVHTPWYARLVYSVTGSSLYNGQSVGDEALHWWLPREELKVGISYRISLITFPTPSIRCGARVKYPAEGDRVRMPGFLSRTQPAKVMAAARGCL